MTPHPKIKKHKLHASKGQQENEITKVALRRKPTRMTF